MDIIQLLVITVAIGTGLVALFLALGLGRFISRPADEELFDAQLADLRRSELEEATEDETPTGWFAYWDNLYSQTGRTSYTPGTAGKLVLGVAIFAGVLGGLVWPGDLIGGLGFAVGSIVILHAVFTGEKNKRAKTLDRQLPNLLSSLRAQIQSGATPQQALIKVADDIPSPLGDELKLVKAELNVNVPMEDALTSFAERVKSREIKFLVSSIQIAVNSGSDLDPQLGTIQKIVAQRARISQKLATAVAQVQPALWVSGIIIPGAFVFSYTSSENNKEFWTSFYGLLGLGVVAALYVAGLFISRKLVKGVENT